MKNYIAEIFNGMTYVLVVLQTNETFQLVELIISIAVSVVLLAYRIWKWWKEANKDGKITKEEIKDGIDIIVDGVEDIQDKIKEKEFYILILFLEKNKVLN